LKILEGLKRKVDTFPRQKKKHIKEI